IDQFVEETNNRLSIFTPQDPRIYYDPKITRDIDVSFVGCESDYRRLHISSLKNEKYLYYKFTSLQNSSTTLPVTEYANIFQKSKIVLNFSKSGSDKVQLKGRIFEVLHCGAL